MHRQQRGSIWWWYGANTVYSSMYVLLLTANISLCKFVTVYNTCSEWPHQMIWVIKPKALDCVPTNGINSTSQSPDYWDVGITIIIP